MPLADRSARSRRKRYPAITNQAAINKVPIRKRRLKNDKGGIWSNAALVAGNVAPQTKVVSSSARRGMNVETATGSDNAGARPSPSVRAYRGDSAGGQSVQPVPWRRARAPCP